MHNTHIDLGLGHFRSNALVYPHYVAALNISLLWQMRCVKYKLIGALSGSLCPTWSV